MKRTLKIALLGALTLMFTAAPAFAQESAKQGDAAWMLFLAAGFAIAAAAVAASFAMGNAISAAVTGVSRNPGAGQRIMTMMILGLALIESLVIYALVVAILLLLVV